MIQGIFYARFFPQEGPCVVAQSPPDLIGSTNPSNSNPNNPNAITTITSNPNSSTESTNASNTPDSYLLDFDVLHAYVIPRKAFCNRLLTVTDPEGKYVVLGFPVLIPHAKYHRNEFIFNFCVVVEEGVERVPYERVVRRLAVTFAEMEKQDEYLSGQDGRDGRDGRDGGRRSDGDLGGGGGGGLGGVRNGRAKGLGRRSVEGLLEIIREDLNNYGECMIPVDDANTINMKLFPHHLPPPAVKGWHVPVAKMKFSEIVDPTWDLTMQKVIAHVDGASDVRRIAFLADVSLDLAKAALRHLLYYDTVLLLDMFFFSNCYAPRPGIAEFVANADGMVDECAAYACVHSRQGLSRYVLIKLMTTFCVGKSVMEWLRGHQENGLEVLRYVDVRRFVQFGVIKGCLYRVHKFVVSKQYIAALATGQAVPKPEEEGGDPLQQYTDGAHCFDQIITEQNLTDEEITEKLKSLPVPPGDLTVFYR